MVTELTGLVASISSLIITVVSHEGEEEFLPNLGDFAQMRLKDEVAINKDTCEGTRKVEVWRKGKSILKCTVPLPKPV
jgi:hypothetical protein